MGDSANLVDLTSRPARKPKSHRSGSQRALAAQLGISEATVRYRKRKALLAGHHVVDFENGQKLYIQEEWSKFHPHIWKCAKGQISPSVAASLIVRELVPRVLPQAPAVTISVEAKLNSQEGAIIDVLAQDLRVIRRLPVRSSSEKDQESVMKVNRVVICDDSKDPAE